MRRFISAGSGDFAFARKFVTQHYQYSGSPTEPASILPSQFFDGQKKKEAVEPLKRLMLAVLADAVRCYQTGFDRRATSRRRVFLEAQQWLFRPGADGAFSFETVCYVLDITPDYLRQMLRNWRARRLGGTCVPVVRRSPVILVKRDTVQMGHEVTKNTLNDNPGKSACVGNDAGA